MNENRTEAVTATDENELKVGDKKHESSKNKRKWIAIFSAVFVYSLILVCITIKIDRVTIANQFKKGLQNSFGELGSSKENDENSFEITNNVKSGETKPGNEEKSIKLDQTVTVGDVMEVTLISAEWTDEIMPSNTTGVYSYYKKTEGEKYFVVKGKAKNLAGENLDIKYANDSQIVINGSYKAKVNIEAEETDGTSFYGTIKPLQTLNIIVYASVSDELYNVCENVKLTLNILNDSSKVKNFYNDDTPHESFTIDFRNSEIKK